MEIEAQKIIADFLLNGEPTYHEKDKEKNKALDCFIKFAEAIGPYLSNEIKPYFLKESNEPLSQAVKNSLDKALSQSSQHQTPPKEI